jgi:tetratricopeptide (TPR) repeat protein
MDPDRTRRYETVNDVALEIERHLKNEPILARAPTVGYRVHKFVRRHAVGVAATALVALALIGGLAGTTIGMVRALRAERLATAEQAKATAINEFMQETLGSADPEIGLGRDVTILSALDAAVERIDESYPNQPEIAAALRETIGWTYVWYGRFDEAERLMMSALEVRRSLFGNQHLDVAKSLYRLGVLHIDRGDPEAAEEPLQQALEIRQSLLGSDHQDVAEVLNAMAILSQDDHDLDRAEELYREAVGIHRAALEEERVVGKLGQVTYAKTLANLSGILVQTGDLEEAEQLLRESVAIYRRLFDRPHPHLAANLNFLGVILREKGDNWASEQATREALDMTRAVYGNQNAAVAYVLLNLSETSEANGAFITAESTAAEALEIARAADGNVDALDASALRRLAQVHMAQSRYTSSDTLLNEAIVISTNTRGSDSRWRLRSIQGECLTELRRYDEAESLLQAALPILQSSERTFELRREADITRTMERLVELYVAWGRPQEAAEYRTLLER